MHQRYAISQLNQWRIHRGQGDVSHKISGQGGQSCKSPPPTFWHTDSDAIAGFTSQSLGLPAYSCKTDSSTAIKLAPRMHKNLSFWAQNRKNIWGWGIARSQDSSLPTPLGAFGASFLALAMIRPSHFLNRGYAPELNAGIYSWN